MFKFIITVSLFAVSGIIASAQAPFEGVIKFKGENTSLSETSTVDWSVKNGNSRLDIVSNTPKAPNVSMTLLFVQGQNVKMLAESGEGKKVYEISPASFAGSEFASAFSVEATGQKGNYAGFECEEYKVTTENSTVSCWVSRSTGINPSSFPSVILGRGIFAALQRNGVQGIPLKITSKDFAGNLTIDQEVVSIQATSVPESNFSVPAGYAKGN